jgi:hypothetical protein
MEITDEKLKLGAEICYGDSSETHLQIMHKIIFVSQQLETWDGAKREAKPDKRNEDRIGTSVT